MAKSDVFDTKSRSRWNPRPPTADFQPKGKGVGNVRGLNKSPVIKSNARIGTTFNFSGTGRPVGYQSNRVGGAIGRTTREVLANHKAWGSAVNMKIHQQNLARAAKISKGINIAGVALALGEGIYKGTKRALDNPEFHKGKAGKSYLDLSINKPGKYGVDY